MYQQSISKWSFSKLGAKKRLRKADWLFLATTVIPTAAALIYFAFLASNVYVSELRFVVRSPDKPSVSGLGVLLKGAGFSNSGDEIYAADDYIQSRDALRALNRDGSVVRAYSNSQVSIFDRFNALWIGRIVRKPVRLFPQEGRRRVSTAHLRSRR